MADEGKKRAVTLKKGDKLKINFQKSPQYRTVHVDGALGGITTRGYISSTFYYERNVLPRVISREIEEARGEDTYRLGNEVVEESLEGIMRQMEVTLLWDLRAAQEFFVWFKDKVRELEALNEVPEEQRVSNK